MKVINSAHSASIFQQHREELLDQYLQRMQRQICGPEENFNTEVPFEEKDVWRCVLEKVLQKASSLRMPKKRVSASNDQFNIFPQLPAELRIEIWELALGFDQLRTVVHCVDERGRRFISNQPISPLLHTCYEARKVYLSHPFRKGVKFAFGSYIHFDFDTIYMIDYEDDKEKFFRFLESPWAHMIQNLAMRKSLACDIPLEGHMSEKQWGMKEFLDSWRRLSVVFHDERTLGEAWEDTSMQLQGLSAREKRKHAEISYARAYMKILNGMMKRFDIQETEYHFVRVVEEED
ncbi:hypothetical protein IFR05_014616 [Cadophora sp. M221]|nr:hypothetical protein IFR05_014616 [Cadophora sp. M221]